MSNFTKLMQQAAAGAGGGDFYPYTIDNSARFDVGSSPYLSRTLGTSGNQKTWTVSYWYKPVSVASWYYQFSTGNSTDFTYIAHTASTSTYGFRLLQNVGNLTQVQMQPTRLLRDTSAWYHIVWAIDTTQATTANRVRLYINGVEETSWQVATYPSQNYNFYWGKNSSVHYVGNHLGNYSNGYMAQVALVFGSQLTPSDFAESKNGVWVPKDITGLSYGAEGSLLAFQDSASLGDDTSGNTNDYASSGLTSSDQMIDTPTNNFATLNPLVVGGGTSTLSEGNLKVVTPVSGNGATSSMAVGSSGKYYAEFRQVTGTNPWVGAGTLNGGTSAGVYSPDGSISWASYGTSDLYENQSVVSSGYGTTTSGDIVGVVIDVDNNQVSFYKNGTLAVTRTFSSGTIDNTWGFVPADASSSSSVTWDCNFGQNGTFNGSVTAQGNTDANGIGDFYYAPPSGALALCTANLPEPAIGPNIDANSSGTTSGENFNTVLWTGDGNSSRAITGVGFQPAWVWIKNRSAAQNHVLHDAVRGAGKYIMSDSTNVEATNTNQLSSFDSDGFTVGTSISTNQSGSSFVGWNWKGNGSGSSNTDGSITSTVSANTDAGFSIVTYTGNATNSTVGHGLNSAPEVVIVKARARSGGSDWPIMFQAANSGNGQNGWIRLNLNAAWATTAILWNNTSPTSSVFSIGTYDYVNDNGTSHVAYCFHSVEGFSKFGSYTGNGSADGPFIFTGFRPAFVMFKRTDSASGGDWLMLDSTREPNNALGDYRLYANSDVAESPYDTVDYLSNGFKMRQSGAAGLNASGGTYIYIAFAENPFKYSNAR